MILYAVAAPEESATSSGHIINVSSSRSRMHAIGGLRADD
jgi:hypothetical protein